MFHLSLQQHLNLQLHKSEDSSFHDNHTPWDQSAALLVGHLKMTKLPEPAGGAAVGPDGGGPGRCLMVRLHSPDQCTDLHRGEAGGRGEGRRQEEDDCRDQEEQGGPGEREETKGHVREGGEDLGWRRGEQEESLDGF